MFSTFPLRRYRLPALVLLASALTLAACHNASVPTLPLAPESASGYRTDLQTRHAEKHMAAAANPLAAEAGREMLRQGGSAIDAAIAMQAVLTLVEPQSSGIGGGALIVLWDGKAVRTYDGRETAPAGATEKLFLQADGTTDGVHPGADRRALGGHARRVARAGTGPSKTRSPALGAAV